MVEDVNRRRNRGCNRRRRRVCKEDAIGDVNIITRGCNRVCKEDVEGYVKEDVDRGRKKGM